MKKWFFTIVIFLSALVVNAQCAMCRAGLENNLANGELEVGAGINMGILYLFIAPYISLTVIGYLWYKHTRKKVSM